MKKIAVIGHFAFGKEFLDGQTVKTKILTKELIRRFGEQEVSMLDTHGGARKLPKLLMQTVRMLKQHENLVILPAHNGLRVIVPWLSFWNLFLKRKVHYAVIGGWLASVIKNKGILKACLKRLAGIYVETGAMKQALEKMGFTNAVIMPNCKDLQILQPEQFPEMTEPYKLCTFSRVMKEKGIEDAVTAVKAVNEKCGRNVYTLDIYGQVDPAQVQWFDALQQTFPECIRYGGLVPFDKSVEVLKDYFALLFPTRFYTEGIPGTVIDAYAAGVPVISAQWESFSDVIEEGKTGYGYEFGNTNALTQLLERVIASPEMFIKQKQECLRKAREYMPTSALEVLCERL